MRYRGYPSKRGPGPSAILFLVHCSSPCRLTTEQYKVTSLPPITDVSRGSTWNCCVRPVNKHHQLSTSDGATPSLGVWQWGTWKTGLTRGLSRAPYVRVWRGVRGPFLPTEKNEIGLAEVQFPAVLRDLLAFFSLILVDILSRSQFPSTHPHYFCVNLDELWDVYFQKVGKHLPPDPTRASASAINLHLRQRLSNSCGWRAGGTLVLIVLDLFSCFLDAVTFCYICGDCD